MAQGKYVTFASATQWTLWIISFNVPLLPRNILTSNNKLTPNLNSWTFLTLPLPLNPAITNSAICGAPRPVNIFLPTKSQISGWNSCLKASLKPTALTSYLNSPTLGKLIRSTLLPKVNVLPTPARPDSVAGASLLSSDTRFYRFLALLPSFRRLDID